MRPYGHDGVLSKSVLRSLATMLVWAGVVMQVVLFAIFGVADVFYRSSSLSGLWFIAWIPSLLAGAVSLFAYSWIGRIRSATDTTGAILSVMVTILGLFWWGYLALLSWAFARGGFFSAD